MRSLLVIQLNQQTVLEYDRNTRLPGKQRGFLDQMDIDMNHGIVLERQRYANPDRLQRGSYVAMKLIQAIQTNDNSMVNAMCAYLVNRLPDLNQIGFEESEEEITVNFHFDTT